MEKKIHRTMRLLKNDPFEDTKDANDDTYFDDDLLYGDFMMSGGLFDENGNDTTLPSAGPEDLFPPQEKIMKESTKPETDPQYDVEEFEEVDETDLAVLSPEELPNPIEQSATAIVEDPDKGTDINKIAMDIEFSRPKERKPEHDFGEDINLIISAPEDDLFDIHDTVSGGYALEEKSDFETAPLADEKKITDNDLIAERGGIPYIKTLNPEDKNEEDENLDPGVKSLVNSILGRSSHFKEAQ